MNNRHADGQKSFGRRPEHHHIIIAKGENVRSFTVDPVVAGICVSVVALFALVYLGATTYLFFRDDLIGATLARQARMQHAYEDRIAALRSQIDRITSRQLLDQESYESKLDQLLARQDALVGRQVEVAQILRKARQTGIHLTATVVPGRKPDAGAPAIDDAATGIGGTLEAVKPMTSSALAPGRAAAPQARPAGFGRDLASVERHLDTMIREQGAALDAIAVATENDVRRIETVFDRLGVRLARAEAAAPAEAAGGPFVPLTAAAEFADRLDRVERALLRFTRLRRSADTLPLARPVRNSRVTSRFGPRLDPFLRRPAMHTGIDFRGTYKTNVYATAHGRVASAGRNGGYGRSIEIDHGNGVTTRYAHLSKIYVKPGQIIGKGHRIGRVGSSGRSTGPHLHYETRINGKAVNPKRYLDAGTKIDHLLQ